MVSRWTILLVTVGVLWLAGCSADVGVDVATGVPTPADDVVVFEQSEQQAESEEPVSERTPDADVLNVRAIQSRDGNWTFHVTVAHPDIGWDDYADGWDVLLPDGTVLKTDASSPSPFTRLLLHPHETEQPFTRSQSGIVVPAGVEQVTVRAHDLVDGFGGREVLVDLTVDAGPDFEVARQ